MLSFGQYRSNFLTHDEISNVRRHHSHVSEWRPSTLEQQFKTPGNSSAGALPLTPPRSPDHDGTLLICETPPAPAGGIYAAGNEPKALVSPFVFCGDAGSVSFYQSGGAFGLEADTFLGDGSLSSVYGCSTPRRNRHEKKPTPDTMKDDKYFERRKRNNLAAKKSRDARKNREDQIAARAAFLEKDNAILRAQVATLQEEAQNLRFLLLQKRERQLSA